MRQKTARDQAALDQCRAQLADAGASSTVPTRRPPTPRRRTPEELKARAVARNARAHQT